MTETGASKSFEPLEMIPPTRCSIGAVVVKLFSMRYSRIRGGWTYLNDISPGIVVLCNYPSEIRGYD